MPTLELSVEASAALRAWLVAELAEAGFTAFVEEDGRLLAYGPAAEVGDEGTRVAVGRALEAMGVTAAPTTRLLDDADWNAQWEASIAPQRIGPFLVRPTWRDVPPAHADAHVLTIDPKMSFGTGYHATTRLVLRRLPAVVVPGARVLDAGAGTGILALAALRLGAAYAVGFDTSLWAAANAAENAALNDLADRLDVRRGAVETVPEHDFDLVLANINRAVLLDLLPDLVARRRTPDAPLVLAGLLPRDASAVRDAADALGLVPTHEATEADANGTTWWSVTLR